MLISKNYNHQQISLAVTSKQSHVDQFWNFFCKSYSCKFPDPDWSPTDTADRANCSYNPNIQERFKKGNILTNIQVVLSSNPQVTSENNSTDDWYNLRLAIGFLLPFESLDALLRKLFHIDMTFMHVTLMQIIWLYSIQDN